MKIQLKNPKNHSIDIPILEEPVRRYIKEKLENTFFDDMEGNQYAPRKILFDWESDEESFVLRLATKKDFSDAVSYNVEGKLFFIDWLIGAKTYYWQVVSEKCESEVYSFTTEDTPRTVYIDGITNTRDIGGWHTIDGRRIKQGIMYRATSLKAVTDEGRKYCLTNLGIRNELDLRPTGDGDAGDGNGSYLGKTVNYYNIGSPGYYLYFLPEEKENLKNIFSYFVEPSHFPMVFHCQIGRDRTGTLAFMLLMLCGVSCEDAIREFDITFFTEAYRLGEHTYRTLHQTHLDPFIEQMSSYGDGTLAENIEKFILDIGLTKDDIAAIRKNIIE